MGRVSSCKFPTKCWDSCNVTQMKGWTMSLDIVILVRNHSYMYIQPKNLCKNKIFHMESSKRIMFSQNIQPKINFHNARWRENQKSLPTARLVKITLTLSSTLHLQEPRNNYAYKYYYSDSHQNLLHFLNRI